MVSEKRRRYMRDYMRRKRALEKQVVMTEAVVSDQKIMGLTRKSGVDLSRCPHCFSKYVTVEGTIIRCQNCGIEIDVSVGLSENRFDDESVI